MCLLVGPRKDAVDATEEKKKEGTRMRSVPFHDLDVCYEWVPHECGHLESFIGEFE